MDVKPLRDLTPGCSRVTHLNNAGAALMPEPVIQTIHSHIQLEAEMGGYEAARQRKDDISSVYASVARLLGASSANIAFTEHATSSYSQALSCIPFEPGDVILTTRNDYASNQIQFLSLHRRLGVRLIRAPDLPQGGVDVAALARLVEEHGPRLVAVTHVPTNSGLVQDIDAIGEICRQHETLYLVDACQSVGQMPIDVNRIRCDFLSATARKFLRGPRGAGFLYVSDRVLEQGLEPLFIDLHGAEWIDDDDYRPADSARRFETWEFAWALVLATGTAAEYALELGLDQIGNRINVLATDLRRRLASINGVRLLDQGDSLCGIVTLTAAGHEPADLAATLQKQQINASWQGRDSAFTDFRDKGVNGALRLSPHCYNTEAEIEQVCAAIAAAVGD